MNFDPSHCDERLKTCRREFDAVWKRLNGQDKKLWAIIMLLLAQLAGLVAAIALTWGKSLMVY